MQQSIAYKVVTGCFKVEIVFTHPVCAALSQGQALDTRGREHISPQCPVSSKGNTGDQVSLAWSV